MSREIYDPVEQPTLYAMYTDTANNPDEIRPDLFGLLHTIQELDKMIDCIQRHYVTAICAKYDGVYLSSTGQMVIHLADAIRHSAIRLEQVPEDLRDDVDNVCRELERLIR